MNEAGQKRKDRGGVKTLFSSCQPGHGYRSRVDRILGVTEEELVRLGPTERQQFICKEAAAAAGAGGSDPVLHFINIQTGELTPIGSFSTPTIRELNDRVPDIIKAKTKARKEQEQEPKEEEEKGSCCKFYALYHIDIGELQTRLRTDDKCLVQVAGNFNCLNVSNRKRKPDSGTLVELAHQQKTQGPAATFGPIASNLYRTHFCMSPPYSGQTLQHQINLLDNVTEYAGTPVNGKLTLTGNEISIVSSSSSSCGSMTKEEQDKEIDAVVQKIRVGLQTDCQVLYGRNKQNKDICLLPPPPPKHKEGGSHPYQGSPPPLIDQCHGAAVNWKSLTLDHNYRHVPAWTQTESKQRDIYDLSRAVLRAAYEGIYLAALVRQRKHLYLTLVGGGVFGNPNRLIVEELARAHKKWANHPASCLEGVYLCAFSTKDNVEYLLEQEGIDVTRDQKQR